MNRPALLLSTGILLLGLCEAEGKTRSRKPSESTPAPIDLKADGAEPDAVSGDRKLISSEIGGTELKFLTSVSELGELQIWLGDKAANAESLELKAIGAALKSNQVEENKLLVRIAAKKGVTLHSHASSPAGSGKIDSELSKLKGAKYDKALIEYIVTLNQQSVGLYLDATRSSDPDIKEFAERMLPVAKDKLQLAGKMSGASPRGTGTPAFRLDAAPPPKSDR